MNKPIGPRAHGVLDYATALATAAAPTALAFPQPAAALCYTLAGGYAGLALVTDYPLAAKRLVRFPAHGAAEVLIGAVLPALPWALGFSKHRAARNFCFALTAVTAVVAVLTDWEGTQRPAER